MASTYTVNLGIEKIGTGEQSGTWGTTTNTNFDLIDQAINGAVAVTLASAGTSGSPNTLAITNGAASDGRNKFIEFNDGGDLGATAYVQLDPNDAEKIVHMRNSLSGGRSVIIFQGTYNASNDFEIPNGKDVVLKFDGAGASATVTQVFEDLLVTAVAATTVDTTNIEVTNLKAKDGTSAGSIADSTGVVTLASSVLTTTDINGGSVDGVTLGTNSAVTEAQIDNININGNTISSTDTNGNVTITPDGTGSVAISKIDVAGGEIDGTAIGANSASTAVFTDLTASGTVSFSGATVSDGGTVTTVNIDGGNIDGTIIGAATPAAGSFTTGQFGTSLNVDGTVTADGLTVADTTGTVATFTSSGVTTALNMDNTHANGWGSNIAFKTGGTAAGYFGSIGSLLGNTDQDLSVYATAGNGVRVYTNGANERMRIDASGNLLVGGTSAYAANAVTIASGGIFYASRNGGSPATFRRNSDDGAIVTLEKDGTTVGSIGTDSGYTRIVGGDGTNGSGLLFSDAKLYPVNAAASIADASIDLGVSGYRFKDLYLSGATKYGTSVTYATVEPSSADLVFTANAGQANVSPNLIFKSSTSGGAITERMRINPEGQLKINTTNWPSNTFGDSAGRHIIGGTNEPLLVLWNETAAATNNRSVVAIGAKSATSSTTFGGGWIYGGIENGTDSDGFLAFNVTYDAGANQEAMRIDSSARLIIGGTTAYDNATLSVTSPSQLYSLITDGGTTGARSRGGFYHPSANVFSLNVDGASGILAFTQNGTERARIDSSGKVGIGTTSPAFNLTTQGSSGTVTVASKNTGGNATVYIEASNTNTAKLELAEAGTGSYSLQVGNDDALMFFDDSSERMRIDSNGNLLVGTTSNFVNNNARAAFLGGEGLRAKATGSGGTASIGAFAESGGPDYYFIGYDQTASAIKFQVLFNGDVENTNNSYGAISDAKLKENVTDATPKLEQLNQVRVVNFNLIGQEQKQLGVVAQELEQIFPGMVSESIDRDADGNDLGTTTKSVKYSVFVPMLIKAMQEQQEIINDLRARVAQLEGA